jgi:hypothetical protein
MMRAIRQQKPRLQRQSERGPRIHYELKRIFFFIILNGIQIYFSPRFDVCRGKKWVVYFGPFSALSAFQGLTFQIKLQRTGIVATLPRTGASPSTS